ncbi:helix-turn-helix transcriptional regulator [Paenibacillus maysiensis]|uniref:helix-turn-helix transcriptional regulator n=1 Tax=Paenibacillus maysiensis TaxID=1155954 RepID=UPI0004711CE0|nr:helix-turn-helix transcriptional regulator [Paenibacillus maysiensis]
MSIVENIKSACVTKGISIPKLEKELGFGRGSIYNWEKSSPSIDKIEKVANYFRLSIDELVGRGDFYGIGWILKKEREEKGVSLEKLAKSLALEIDDLEQYELGGRPMSVGTASLISDELGISLSELLEKHSYYEMTNADEIPVNSSLSSVPDWASPKDIRDFKTMLEEDGPIMFDGVPISNDDKERIKRVMEAMFWDIKAKNKKTYGRKKKDE